MQPMTTKSFDKKTFDRLTKTYTDISNAQRMRKDNPRFSYDIPHEVGFQLTRRCNMRCQHCFLWDDEGIFQNLEQNKQKEELSVDIIEKVLKQTYTPKGNVYIWGGEPLIHSDFDEISKLFEKDTRFKVLSTNLLLLEEKADSYMRMSNDLATLVSVDGFKDEYEAIRGKGTYKNLQKNLGLLFDLKKKNEYKGLITINCVLSDNMIPRMLDFMEEYNNPELIDTVYFSFPYYISNENAKKIDEVFRTRFSWLNKLDDYYTPSWYSYTHHISEDSYAELKEQLAKIQEKKWNVRIRQQPPLEIKDVDTLLRGSSLTAQGRCACFTPSIRTDILADGSVLSCKLFPEFTLGNVYETDILDIWRSEKYARYREEISKDIMPMCSQCIFLYLYGR